jgi:aspartyl-tRNA(Asn)/glutamyl-tRNA(Gln) amidotransferase subunit B
MPELPDAKKARFIEQYKLSPYDAGVLAGERAVADFYETVARGRDAKAAANWVTGELFGVLNKKGLGIEASPVSAESLGQLLDLMANATISGKQAKDVFAAMVETSKSAAAIVEEKGLRQITDPAAIEKVVDEVLAAHPEPVALYKGGKQGVLGFLIKAVNEATGGKANPKLVSELLRQKLQA